MPIYDYKCKYCQKEFLDVYSSIEDRDDISNLFCGNKFCNIQRMVSTSRIVASIMTNFKIPDGFKDVLGNIKKGSGKNNSIDF